MNDETKIPEAEETEMQPEETADSARLISVSEAARRVEAEREKCQAEAAAAGAAAEERIRTLEEELHRAQAEAAYRDARLRCRRILSQRRLSEEMAELILADGEGDVSDEELTRRAELLGAAVEEAAIRELRERAAGIRPGAGGAAPLTGAMIRDTPIARLAELMRR